MVVNGRTLLSYMRADHILDACCCMCSTEYHYLQITTYVLEHNLGIPDSTIKKHIGLTQELRAMLIDHALMHGFKKVVAQAILCGHPCVSHLSKSEKRKIIQSIPV